MSLRAQISGLLLSDKIMEHPHFGLDGHIICGCDLRAIGAAVRDERIDIKKASGEGPKGWYMTDEDAFYFRFERMDTLTQKALVIHEAVHAALDMNKASNMKVLDSEGTAYVHQCFYMVPFAGEGERGYSEVPENDKVWKAAWSIAKTLRSSGTPSAAQIAALRAGVKVHKNYKDEYNDIAKFDGIPA